MPANFPAAHPMLSLVLPPIAVAIIYFARMKELGARRDTIAGPIRERWSLRLFLLVGTAIWAGALVEYFVRGHRLEWPWFLGGVACGVASFAIRRRAIAALGRFWSLHVEIREEHQFVKDGPFRWMRHPTYFSMLLELISVTLILQATFCLALVPFLYLPALAYRLRLEEPALVAKFGDRYRDYMRTTPAILPWRWPHAR
jgi:protein-S-isoprenylcysteine O-methyltransferase Ste14